MMKKQKTSENSEKKIQGRTSSIKESEYIVNHGLPEFIMLYTWHCAHL